MIASFQTLSTEYRFVDANSPEAPFQVVLPREENHEYSVSQYEDDFYIRTNWNADNFRLMKAPIGTTDKSEWEEVIPHREDVLLEGVEIFSNHLVVMERKEGFA